jgi:sarcosine oxidase subunit beta
MGVRTVVFEKGAPASGPTGRSSGICRAYYTNDFLATVARDSIEMFAFFEEYTSGRNAGFHRTGFLFMHPWRDMKQLELTCEQLNSLGVKVELMQRDTLAREFPEFDFSDVALGAWEVDAGYADPATATLGLIERAVELGAEPRLRTTITAIDPLGAGGAIVTEGDGNRVICDRLLIAAGPWTRSLTNMIGVDIR